MKNILMYLNENKDWIFSGIGIVIVTGVIGIFKSKKNKKSEKKTQENIQIINNGSNNNQAGRDINVK